MFFILSKIFWAVVTPLTLISLIFVLGLLLVLFRKPVWGRRILGVGIALFLLLGVLPVGPDLMVYLERQYHVPAPMPDKVDGIIVLGGGLNAEKSYLYHQASIGEYGDRITEMVRLSRIYPQARIVYSGGEGRLDGGNSNEADEVKKLLQDMGVLDDRYIFEERSRNTYENMTLSRDLVHPQPGEKWLLVTSAFHLPRSVAIFEKGGWQVIPYPAGYLEDGEYLAFRDLDVLGNFYKLQVAAKEIVGIIAYSFTGKL